MRFSPFRVGPWKSVRRHCLLLLVTLSTVPACGERSTTAPPPPAPSYIAGSTITASQSSLVADGASSTAITVQLRDSVGNAAHGSGGTLSLYASAGSLDGVVDHHDGTYTATFTAPTIAGTVMISANLNGRVLAQTLTLTLTAGPVNIARSVIRTASSPTVPADGFEKCVIYVEARDTNDNPTDSGVGQVTFATTLGTLADAATNSTGHYSITIKSSQRGTALVTAKIDGQPIPGSVAVQFTGNYWLRKAALPEDRQVFGIGAYNGILYVVGGGGWDTQSYSGAVNAYDPATDQWTSKTRMPTARGELSAGVIDGILYAVGGYNSHDLNTVEAYDIVADKWTTKAPLPTPREGLAVAVVNGILYAIGGNQRSSVGIRGSISTSTVTGPLVFRSNLQSADRPLGVVEAYDPATNTWTTKSPMPTPRSMLAVGVLNGIIYAIGGASGSLWGMRTVEAYDPATDSWSRKSDMPSTSAPTSVYGRAALAAAVLNGTLYAIGGFAVYSETNLVESYDPVLDRWNRGVPMPTMRQSLGAVVIDGILYAVGGACYDDTLNAVEAYIPP
ncbi:MAG TPA: invasin domain 3-containing protein [Gemmatimonadaceae bacterium]|jgi:N-acetylneuraminic acid mutarotase|nr:invasin domain 3-containing protein [Gemmatimonadaceae bacterium]